MKSWKFLLLLWCMVILGAPAAEAVVAVRPASPENAEAVAEDQHLTKKEARQQRRLERQAIRQEVKQAIREWKKEDASDTDTLLLVIIAILLPPLAMAIYEGGLTNRFWISLLLTLLFYLPGLIYTLVIILGGR